ncbi:MAG: hypothetical protein Q7S92_00420 [Candidatus Diapherotrites archaeon]|nr:hypothetical protein [Candidatus Diapherotrites archaeon]
MFEFSFLTALFFTEIFQDYNLALKIFALLSIISFVKNHVGTGPLGLAIMIGISWFILFDAWSFFGGVYVLYTLLTMGVSGILIDFFFVGQQHITPHGMEAPKGTQADVAERNRARQHAMHQAHARGRMLR